MPGLTESSSELMLLFIFASAVLWISYYINKDERALSGAAFASGFSILVAILTAFIGFGVIPAETKEGLFDSLSITGIVGGAVGIVVFLCSVASMKVGDAIEGVQKRICCGRILSGLDSR